MAGEEKRMRLRIRKRIENKNNLNDLKQLFIQVFSLDSAMHHVGRMAALNHAGFGAKALNLTWFGAHSAIVRNLPSQVFFQLRVFRAGITQPA
jgi:hypothetical protein